MEYQQRKYPQFSACGLNCGLCPRYYTSGTSRCPGCAGDGFLTKHPKCGVLSCSQRKHLEYCYQCDEFPCKKYDGADQSDSFISHLNQLKDLEKAKNIGMDAYSEELNEKIAILETLLENYDDGRRKSFFCTALNLLELQNIKNAVAQIELEVCPEQSIKERTATAVRLFQTIADKQGISLSLRKKQKHINLFL
jgi:hypothetical protein